jgi:crotonobetaine/carnitine-CoA ligase
MRPTTVGDALQRRLDRTPDEPFFHCGAATDPWLTFRALDDRARRLAGGLAALGVARGDRVVLLLPNRAEMVELLFAIAALGAVQVPLNSWLKGDFLRYQFADCGAQVLVTDTAGLGTTTNLLGGTGIRDVVVVEGAGALSYANLLRAEPVDPVRATPGDLLSISYTSGTTADPKGCMLSTGYYAAVGTSYGERGWVVPSDRIYTSFPLFHTSGQMVALMSALVNDASLAVAPEFSASRFRADAVALDATMLLGVGVTASALLDRAAHPEDGAHPFRLASFVPLPPDRQQEFERRFRTPVMAEGYGQTECVPITASPVDGARDRATSGSPAPLVEVRIEAGHGTEAPRGAVGEIVVRPRVPHAMFSGYWGKPADTVAAWADLWHHTGDFGRMDDAGFVTFVDRKKDVIRRRGENVSSAHLEAVLRSLAGVAEVAVCAVPASLGDDDIKVCLVETTPGAVTPEAVFEHLRHRVAYFAMPRYVAVRESLPVNALGRVMKHRLRDEGIPEGCWDFEHLGLVVLRHERRGTGPAKETVV